MSFNVIIDINGRRLYRRRVAPADRVHLDAGLEREKARDLPPGVGMGFAHEAVADQADSKSAGHSIGINRQS